MVEAAVGGVHGIVIKHEVGSRDTVLLLFSASYLSLAERCLDVDWCKFVYFWNWFVVRGCKSFLFIY